MTEHLEMPDNMELPPSLLPYGFARRYGVLLRERDGHKELCHRQDVSVAALGEVQRHIGRLPRLVPMDDTAFTAAMAITYEQQRGAAAEAADDLEGLDLASLADSLPETSDLLEQEDDAPIIRLINALLQEAIREDASDIHVETFERRLVVRMRVDGVLREVLTPKRELAPLLVSRIKVMARMDIAEKRIPQDGRISLRIGGRDVDVRVSTMPASNGERVVLRLLDKQAGRLQVSHLGMGDTCDAHMRELIHKPHGIILVTGPTGSGKTTTLYASLTELNDSSRNILTVEDPIEYQLEGIGQTQVNTKVDMTFARGLRAILRQDPDVVMVGEIRDLETAEIAVQASLTGHLVLSTLHTNTAVGAVTRLQDMGIEPFLLSSSLLGSLAQRLVRVLCDDCKTPYQASASELEMLGLPANESCTLYHPNGCEACNNQGYRGRTGIYELVLVDDTLRQLIHDRAGELELNRHARTLTSGIREDGWRKVLGGHTSVEEVLRVTRED
ncbi:type II secretion system protein GspE [Alcanivorax sp. HI0083]|nr:MULTISPECIES: type II secretion system ATPase GspE [unclassified Alcanivorax]KZY31501.1 type II secretion system protein GspE [Alcanivorax sp. HI0044]KZZ23512.1 type II secretion system protein GspE [Alcanivorax sp. HI0083]PHR68008.1 MAG: type II secretion system protein GspE [Alcanivorax sp.]